MRHYKLNNNEADLYILLDWIRIRSGLRDRIRIRSKTGPDPQNCS
jgi:hypothetical protein